MSTSPSVIRRFVEYYAGLDAQPPAALATLYHPDATLSDPFGQQILHQRDYYDAGEMIYEHLPLLGWAVRGVKRRVRS